VVVPDERIEVLKNMYNPKRTISTGFEFTDIAGLVKGASTGEGLGNKFLSHIREVDAICHVVRCFDDGSIIHVEGKTSPIRDIEIINLELMLADLEIINNRIDKMTKKVQTTKDKEGIKELEVLRKSKEALERNIPLRLINYTNEEIEVLKSYKFLTLKPIIYLANINEENINNKNNNYIQIVEEYAKKEGSKLIKICAKIESELSELEENDKQEMLKALGIKRSGLDQLIQTTYDLLNLATFFTVGTDEVRAWTFKKGMNARDCSGIIHSDFARGFIRAEVISYNDLINYGSELKVKEQGKARLEGKDYLMQDGDICHFRFNV
ncbi:MAG: redox-regulated ATPase YchF, partial [Tenericutes bacterium]|nr:redox-regulated ATPase YchF [Mycoplasmatota bacterium]